MTRLELAERRLKLQQLRVALAVGQTGSMARAAKQLATSQSVVSKAVAELETMLGVRLFDRSSQGVEPTLYGRTLIRHGVAIFDDVRTSIGEIEYLADPGVGELRIGTTEPQTGLVAAAIERMSLRYPRANFTVAVATSPTLVDRELRGRRVDVVVAPLQPNQPDEGLESTFLYNNHWRAVVSGKSPWARRRKITLSDLVQEPWCAPPADLIAGAVFFDAFRTKRLPLPRVIVSCAANHLCHRLLSDGRFVGLSSDGWLHFDTQVPTLTVLPVELRTEPLAISIITLKGRTITPLAQPFIDCALEVANPLTKKRQ